MQQQSELVTCVVCGERFDWFDKKAWKPCPKAKVTEFSTGMHRVADAPLSVKSSSGKRKMKW